MSPMPYLLCPHGIDMFVNHVTVSFSQFITYRSLGSVSLDRSPSLLHDKSVSAVKLTTVWISCPLLWCVTLHHSHQRQPYLMNNNGGYRHTISPWSCFILSCYSENEWTSFNSRTRPIGSGTQSIIAPLAWSTERECACWLSNHLVHGFASGRLTFVHVHTFASYTPLTGSPNEQSD